MTTENDAVSINEFTDRDLIYTLTDDSNPNAPVPMNITGATFTWLMVLEPHGDTVLQKSNADIVVIQNDIDATKIKVSIRKADIPFGTAGSYQSYLRKESGSTNDIVATAAITIVPAPFKT